MAQLAFAVSTLYRSRGDQTTQYGYAAFGLTVTQYAMMSLLNLLGNLFCPQYPALYLVRSQAMTEAEQIPNGHALFEGIVGTLSEDNIQAREANRRNPQALPKPSPLNLFRHLPKRALMLPLVWLPTAVSVAITYWLSRFRRGSSTIDQRASTMGLVSSWKLGWLSGWERCSRAQCSETQNIPGLHFGASFLGSWFRTFYCRIYHSCADVEAVWNLLTGMMADMLNYGKPFSHTCT